MNQKRMQGTSRSDFSRETFFTVTVFNEKIRDTISGKNEDAVIKLFDSLGYVLEKEYVRQYPVGKRYVLDFAFINERFCIEVDGKDHLQKKARRSDKTRDSYLRTNGWVILRIQDKELFGYKQSFYKNLIKEIYEERHEQWQNGFLFPIGFIKFNENDYE